MNIPNLPTDNLYKFVALTGVFLTLVCFGVIEYRITQQIELDTEISLGKESLQSDMSQITKEISDMSLILKKFEEISPDQKVFEGKGKGYQKKTLHLSITL
ncbi:hypothetical protein [uncultured Cocleimonas sp.]|uniref:hypothetical protein n=1 Tax=uncultured Cocleimonas sp. TaxID=1051587 RepID=UPI002633EAC7|nr:hypothetical protein [uncultured Cocleimonas sp.]